VSLGRRVGNSSKLEQEKRVKEGFPKGENGLRGFYKMSVCTKKRTIV